jgi:hypothetical protein
MVCFLNIENAENMVRIFYLIIVFYAIPVQSNAKIFFSNSNNHYILNRIITMTNLIKINHDFVPHNTVIRNFQKLSNNGLTTYDDTTIICKNI